VPVGNAAWGADPEMESLQRHVYLKEGLRFDSWNPHLRLNAGGRVGAEFWLRPARHPLT